MKLAKSPHHWNDLRSLAGTVVISLILQLTACQTTNPSEGDRSSQAGKDETATGLSVAASYLDTGRPDKAMGELRGILDRRPNDTDALNLMGITQLALRNPNRALIHLEKAWKLKPTTSIGVNLSSVYFELSRFKDAERILTGLLKRNETPAYPHKDRIYHNYALVLEKTGRLIAAEKMYRKATEENPMFYLSRLKLAKIYTERKKNDLAQRELEAARFACAACLEPAEALIRHYAKNGDTQKARRLIHDYRLTEGLPPYERRRASELEAELFGPTKTAATESPQKMR